MKKDVFDPKKVIESIKSEKRTPAELNLVLEELQKISKGVNYLVKEFAKLEKEEIIQKPSKKKFPPYTLVEVDTNNHSIVLIILKWLNFLINKIGLANLDNVLDYYVSVNWITNDIKNLLISYARGLESPSLHTKKTVLNTKDHTFSLYVLTILHNKEPDNTFDHIINDPEYSDVINEILEIEGRRKLSKSSKIIKTQKTKKNVINLEEDEFDLDID